MSGTSRPKELRKLRAEIIALFQKNPKRVWWYSTLQAKTGADLKDVVDTCHRLVDDGKIHVQHPSHQRRRMKISPAGIK